MNTSKVAQAFLALDDMQCKNLLQTCNLVPHQSKMQVFCGWKMEMVKFRVVMDTGNSYIAENSAHNRAIEDEMLHGLGAEWWCFSCNLANRDTELCSLWLHRSDSIS